MRTIEIDFEVYKALTARRETEQTTYNDVLRGLLELPRAVLSVPESAHPQLPNGPDKSRIMSAAEFEPAEMQFNGSPPGIICGGVFFPSGTKLKGFHRGREHIARVENGAIIANGKPFTSPSRAAIELIGNAINGWTFWKCQKPGSSVWIPIDRLRSQLRSHR